MRVPASPRRPRRPRRRRHARRLAALVALLLLAPVFALGLLLVATLPARSGRTALPGLVQPVTIRFDPHQIPWIRAGSDLDAAEALGFLHASYRMAQLDLGRRIALGRVAELAGPAALPLDRFMRTMGFAGRVAAEYKSLPAHTRAMLQAYARGVNAAIAARGRLLAPEFLLTGPPQPWQAQDGLLWGKTMTLYLSGNYREKLARLALSKTLSPQAINALWPRQKPPLPPEARLAPGAVRLAAELVPLLPRFGQPFIGPATASNEWAVDGAHSATHAPLLAGDPHLGLSLPSIWYLARIDLPGQVLAGATAPGTPFLILGHNRDIAWSFTTSATDTQDLFVETLVDPGHYAAPGGPLPFLTRTEWIRVRGAPSVRLTVRETRHGPIISDLVADPALPKGQLLALAAAGLAPNDTAAAGIDALDRARSRRDALAAAPRITSPTQNLLVADRTGIAMVMTGRVPLRAGGQGLGPVDGASGRFDWTGFASAPDLPVQNQPASGRLINANEPTAPPDFPVFLGAVRVGDWRARRIRAMLDATKAPDLADFARMQTDARSLYATDLLAVLLPALHPRTALGRRAQALLRGFDGTMARGRPQPLIFNAWLQRFALDRLASRHVAPANAGPRLEFVAALLAGPSPDWCGGDCAGPASLAFDSAMADLAARYGPDPARWRWGRAHQARFANPILGQLPLLGWLTTRRIAADGDDATIGRGAMAERDRPDFTDLHAASFRAVYDLGALDRSRFILAPGQSGNPASRFAADLLRPWRDGKTLLLGPNPAHSTGTWILLPKAPS